MRILYLVLAALPFAACTTARPMSTTQSDGSTMHVVKCEKDWADCYRSARQSCGGGEFTEIDRLTDGATATAGRLERMHSVEGGIENHVYSENPRDEVFGRVLTIRCNSPARRRNGPL